MKYKALLLALLLMSLTFSQPCVVYISGIGCPHCARVDPVLLDYALAGKVIVIEYEIYRKPENSAIATNYWQRYNIPSTNWGVPFIFFNSKDYLVGSYPILQNLDSYLLKYNESNCLLLDGEKKFEEIDLNNLPGKPAIWYKDRIIVKGETYLSKELQKNLFENLESIKNLLNENTEKCFEYSYGKKCFEKSYNLYDWKIYYLTEASEKPKNENNLLYFSIIVIVVIIAVAIFLKLRK